MRLKSTHLLLLAAAALVLGACSTEKDRWINRTYHETTARFNAYFNGLESYEEAVANFEKSEQLNFEELLPYYYWPDESKATALFAPMDRAIEKSAKVVKNHSMVFSGKQRNEYVFRAYLLIARARFYKYELLQSLEACEYIIDNFGRIEEAADEVFFARLLAAQIHVRMGNGFRATDQLEQLYTKKLPKNQLHQAQVAYAYHFASEQNWQEAQTWTQQAAETAPDKETRVRLTYINAQLLAKMGLGYESAMAYEQVLKLHPNNYDITFSAQMKRAENFDVYMEDVSIIEKELNKMLRDDKNITYRDQIYYVWAQKQLDLENYPRAEELLRNSIAYSVNNAKQKGKSYLALAGVSYDFEAFVPAQAFYDSAVAVLPADYPGLDTLRARRAVLDELVGYLDVIALEDSLQAMYGMDEKALEKKFSDYIIERQRREEEAKRQAEIAALRAGLSADLASAGPQAGGSGQWYFYNATVRTQGKSDFQTRWGDRKLEDHWRTKDKPVDGFGEFALVQPQAEEQDSATVQLPIDEYSVEYYLARVLKTPEDLDASERRESAALAELGFVYKDGLGNKEKAERSWSTYLRQFAAHNPTPKVLYGSYLLQSEIGNTDLAAERRATLLNEYSMSPYAVLLRDGAPKEEIPAEEQAAYDAAYAEFEKGAWRKANLALDRFADNYPGSTLSPKAALLRAFISGGQGQNEQTITDLKAVTELYAGTPEATRASQILSMLADPESEQNPNTQGRGDQRVTKMEFPDQPQAPHKFVLAIPAENAMTNELRNAFADFNKEYFKFDNLKIQNIFYDQNTQLIIISGLKTKEKAEVYLQTFNNQGANIFQYYPQNTSVAFYINNPNFGTVYRDKVLKEYIQYFKSL